MRACIGLWVVLIALIWQGAGAGPILLDTFDDPLPRNYYWGVAGPRVVRVDAGKTTNRADQAGLPGVHNAGVPGNRTTFLTLTSAGDDGIGAQAATSLGSLVFSNDDGQTSKLRLDYGTYSQDGRELDVAGNLGRLEDLNFFYCVNRADTSSFMDLEITTGGGADIFSTASVFPGGVPLPSVPEGGPAYVFRIFALSLRNGSNAAPTLDDMADIDGIRTRLWTTRMSGDMNIGSFGLDVPEPATLTLLGLGALALVRRRRKS